MTARRRTLNIGAGETTALHARNGGSLARPIHIAALAALACALPPTAARAAPVGAWAVVSGGPGDKADPAIDAQVVVYSTDAPGDRDVVQWTVGAAPDAVTSVATAYGPGDQDQPAVHRATVAYRSAARPPAPAGIWIVDRQTGSELRTPASPAAVAPGRRCQPAAPVSRPVVSDVLAAWTCGSPGARSVAVSRFSGALEEYDLAGAGDAFGPSVSGARVAYVDASDGSAWLHDSTPASRQTSRVCGGTVTGVSLAEDLGAPVVAVARAGAGGDADIELWDPTGGLGTAGRIVALQAPGEQRNPHVSGEWVAFEDLSTGVSQVVLWRWTSGLVFVPHPTTSNQTLSDLSVLASGLRAVWADDGDGTGGRRDIALYQLPLPVPDDGRSTPWPWRCTGPGPRPAPATCDAAYPDDVDPCACHDDDDRRRLRSLTGCVDDPCAWTRTCAADRAHRTPVVLARLELERRACGPHVEEVSFDATPYPGDPLLPVLVCVDLDQVTAGWLALDHDLLAGPDRLHRDVRHLEWRADVGRRRGEIAGLVAGKIGARLVARVIADPGSYPDPASCSTGAVIVPSVTLRGGGSGGSGAPGSGAGTSAAGGVVAGPQPAGSGCGTPGGAGALGGLALVALLRLRRRAAAARE